MFYTANHFSGRGQVGMDWHLLGNGVAPLDVAAVGALDFATIRVTCDGPSDLGDHVIIARTNQVCHVPLLAGATYAVESDLPIAYSAVSSEHAHIVTNSTTNLRIHGDYALVPPSQIISLGVRLMIRDLNLIQMELRELRSLIIHFNRKRILNFP